jgi:hypothetical protein
MRPTECCSKMHEASDRLSQPTSSLSPAGRGRKKLIAPRDLLLLVSGWCQSCSAPPPPPPTARPSRRQRRRGRGHRSQHLAGNGVRGLALRALPQQLCLEQAVLALPSDFTVTATHLPSSSDPSFPRTRNSHRTRPGQPGSCPRQEHDSLHQQTNSRPDCMKARSAGWGAVNHVAPLSVARIAASLGSALSRKASTCSTS